MRLWGSSALCERTLKNHCQKSFKVLCQGDDVADFGVGEDSSCYRRRTEIINEIAHLVVLNST